MGGVAILKIDIVADASKAAKSLGGLGDAASKSGDDAAKSGSKWKTFAAGAARVAGAAALGGLVAMFKTGAGEQKDFLSGQAQLANGIKTTGNAAHVSVTGLEDLASSVQNYSGQTDDSIVASEKLLLTFTNVRNEAGKNNDIFNQATKMTADMAAKMGGDASKYAVQLGKALNDPVKGITALTRVGVSFSAQQKNQIKAMQESGNTLGAQKIIMAELRKEFGGSAKAAGETLPGQMERAKRSFEDISQELVASFMPVLTQLAAFLTKNVLPAFKSVMSFLSSHHAVLAIVAVAFGTLAVGLKAFSAAAAGIKTAITVFKMIGPAIKGIGVALNFLSANPIILIIVAIVALVVAIVILYKRSATFRKIVQGAFKAVAAAGKALWGALRAAFAGIMVAVRAVWSFIQTAMRAIVTIVQVYGKILYYAYIWPFQTAYKVAKTAVQALVSWLPGAWRSIVSGIKTGLAAVYGAIRAPFLAAWGWIKNSLVPAIKGAFNSVASAIGRALSGVASAITAPFSRAWSWIRNSLVPALKGAFNGVASAIGRALSGVAGAITRPFSSAWSWISAHVVSPIRNAFTGMAGAITRALSGVTSAITAPFSAAWSWVSKHVFGPIKSVWNGIANTLNAIHFSVKVPSWVPHWGGKGWTFGLPHIPTLATGGVVSRPTLAMVGEGRGREIVAPESLLREIMGSGGTTVVVNGALDPAAVARQIRLILKQDQRRRSGVVQVGAPVAGVT